MTVVAGLFVGLLAADMSGTWTLKFEKDFSGHPASHECTLQQQGEKLSGTCDEAKITGQVKDGKVTFEHKTGKKNDIVVHYTGVVNKEGSFMKGAWQFVDPTDKKEKTGRFAFERR